MAPERKLILSAGMGRYASADPNASAHFGPDAAKKTKELLNQSIEQAKAAGFDIVPVDMNPNDPADSIKRFVEELKNGNFVGVNIGYGVRGHKEHTELFENLLNKAWATKPGIKIMFSNGPHEVITAIRRSFPEAF